MPFTCLELLSKFLQRPSVIEKLRDKPLRLDFHFSSSTHAEYDLFQIPMYINGADNSVVNWIRL